MLAHLVDRDALFAERCRDGRENPWLIAKRKAQG